MPEQNVRLRPKYPIFDICEYIQGVSNIHDSLIHTDPAVYPHFRIYPSINAQQLVSTCRRKTHQELHDMVVLQSFPKIQSPKKTHQQLHDTVFGTKMRPLNRLHSRSLSSGSSKAHSPRNLGNVIAASMLPRPISDRQSISTSDVTLGTATRRPVSLGRAMRVPAGEFVGVMRTASLHRLLPVGERKISQSLQTADASVHVTSSVHGVKPNKKRDSIVLEKARNWGVQPTQQKETRQLSMKDLSEFPMPPAVIPPIPALPKSSLETNRPTAKIDRSKLPFR